MLPVMTSARYQRLYADGLETLNAANDEARAYAQLGMEEASQAALARVEQAEMELAALHAVAVVRPVGVSGSLLSC